MTLPLLLLGRQAQEILRVSGNKGGFQCAFSEPDAVAAVIAIGNDAERTAIPLEPLDHHLRSADTNLGGVWYRVEPGVNESWVDARLRHVEFLAGEFTALLPGGMVHLGPALRYLAITICEPTARAPEIVAWLIEPIENRVTAIDIDVKGSDYGWEQLRRTWSIEKLADTSVVLVGAGSIGSAAALGLAAYGIGEIHVVDPDHLRWHNSVRHSSSPSLTGLRKPAVVAAELDRMGHKTRVIEHNFDIVTHADQLRALVADVDLVLCAADGTMPRRVVSHVARRANVDAILACVLADGAIGELIRLRPWRKHGCLLCRRTELADRGVLDVTVDDAPYGLEHLPGMSAVGGDLHLVGQMAAKVAISTISEKLGVPGQSLPGETCVMGLRPLSGWGAPYDVQSAGEVKWSPAPQPIPGCPTCGA